MALVPATVLLMFDQPIDDPVETIKTALSRALVHYYPMAGRLVVGADGELHIACTGEGVPFVGASASSSLDEVLTALPLMDLSVRYPADCCRLSDALLQIQVTEFTYGGFVVGATWNHVVADAAGMAQFVQAVGELASGMPVPSVVPVRTSDRSLPCMPPPPPPRPRSGTRGPGTGEMASLDLTVSSSLIGRIKAECGGRCTVFDAVAAVLWRCRTRAVMSNAEAPATLAFTTNVRDLVGFKEGYYGNCLALKVVPATTGAVAGSDVKDLVKLIRLAKEKIPELFGSSTSVGGGTEQQAPEKYNMLGVSSWLNLGFETADMGRGRPARVMWQPQKTVGMLCVLCPPCKGKLDINILSYCVRPESGWTLCAELLGSARVFRARPESGSARR
ncbi:unnamed protein product [Alopecurus aequalis]